MESRSSPRKNNNSKRSIIATVVIVVVIALICCYFIFKPKQYNTFEDLAGTIHTYVIYVNIHS